LLEIINKPSKDYGIYHYSNEGSISWYDFAVEIFKQHKRAVRVVPIPTNAYPIAAKRPAYTAMDLTKAKITFGNTIPLWKQRII
jgi:dTDP-4-dehydrorhamnose reductase